MTDGILDANIVIDLLENEPDAMRWYPSVQHLQLSMTPVVWMEVVQGAFNKRVLSRILKFLNQFNIEHPTSSDNLWAMNQISNFSLSHGLELEDVMIASVAVGLGVPLYTRNIKHFSFLPGLQAIRPY